MANKDSPMIHYKPENLVFVISHQTSILKTSSLKFRIIYTGSIVVCKITDKFQYILKDIKGKKLNGIFYFNTFKEASLRATKGSDSMQADLKQIINLGVKIIERNKFVWNIVLKMCYKHMFLENNIFKGTSC